MSSAVQANTRDVARFRTKLFGAMMLVVAALTGLGLYFAQRNAAAVVQRDLQQDFQAELSALHKVQELRQEALAERCRTLVAKPRIHAALEDNALDLLYPSAKDELREIMQGPEPPSDKTATTLHGSFYRFLDGTGGILPARDLEDVGRLSEKAEAQLALPKLPETLQIGYLPENPDLPAEALEEIMAVPIFSTETGGVISALVVGFKPVELTGRRAGSGMKSGIWVNGQMHLPSLVKSARSALAAEISRAAARANGEGNFIARVNGGPHLLFYKQLNPNSIFPPAYEVCIYPLADSIARRKRLRWQVGGAGALFLIGGFVVSHVVAARLSRPVEKLAVDSETNRAQRQRAEAKLASTSEELQRSARYSADASHQLKSPVTVLRAGLETLLAREDFKPEVYDELSALVHQTYRLTGVIDDLLLLSRMDAGHLRIESKPINLTPVIEEWLEDLGALPESLNLKIEKNVPDEFYVAGEKRYTSLIVQNLLENARKYNRPGGTIRITAEERSDAVVLTIYNTGRPIPAVAQKHIFDRFHRGSTGSAVPGHGLGLNLARELARLHHGDLRLVRSDENGTEFEVLFPRVEQPFRNAAKVA